MTELKTREVIIAGFASKLEEIFKQSIEEYRLRLVAEIECPEYDEQIDWTKCAEMLLYFLAKWGALRWTDEKTEKLKQNPNYGLKDQAAYDFKCNDCGYEEAPALAYYGFCRECKSKDIEMKKVPRKTETKSQILDPERGVASYILLGE